MANMLPQVLKQGGRRLDSYETWKYNITSAVILADLMKTALGPYGHYKLFIDYLDNIKISARGITVLRLLKQDFGPRQDEKFRPFQENPCIKHLIEAGHVLHDEVNDGVVTMLTLMGALLEQAAQLINLKVHRNVIVSGYRLALKEALREIETMAIPVGRDNIPMLRSIVRTSLSKYYLGFDGADKLSQTITEAYFTLLANNGNNAANLDLMKSLQIVVKAGASSLDTTLINGIIIDKELKHPLLPKRVENARIALIDTHMSVNKPKTWHEVRINTPSSIRLFQREEEKILEEMAAKIDKLGVNVVLCNKSIDDRLLYMLGRRNIMAVRDVSRIDFEMLAKAVSARISPTVNELAEDMLGYAELVEERDIGSETWVFVEGCIAPKSVAILVRGSSYWFAEETKDLIKSAARILHLTLLHGYAVPGGGATELYIAAHLKKWSGQLRDRRQLAVEAFAKALEKTVSALLETTGVDVLKTLTDMHHAQTISGPNYGFDARVKNITDVVKAGIIDPLFVKRAVWKAAVEVACSILRVDETFLAGRRAWGELPKISEGSMEISRKGMIGEPGSYPTYGEPY